MMKMTEIQTRYAMNRVSQFLTLLGLGTILVGLYNLVMFDVTTITVGYKEIFRNLIGILSGFAASIFILIWRHIQKTNQNDDIGLLYLAAAILVWGIVGVIPSSLRSLVSEGASTLNNLFILLSIYYFDDGGPNYNHSFFKFFKVSKKNYKKKVIGYTIIFTLLIIGLNRLYRAKIVSQDFSPIPDLLFSSFTVVALGLGLWFSFKKRKQSRIAVLSLFAISLMFISQFLSTWKTLYYPNDEIAKIPFLSEVSLLTYKVLLMLVFGALAISWHYSKKIKLIEFDRQDMLHMARNILKEFKHDLHGQQKKLGKDADYIHQTFFIENITRIEALRDVFDELYYKDYSSATGNVYLDKYLIRVLESLKKAYPNNEFITDIEFGKLPVLVRADSATGLAKIIVESVSNAFKHGDKWVSIKCAFRNKDQRIIIRVEGKGKFEEKKATRGFGLNSISQFLTTLDGSQSYIHTSNGTEFTYEFPLTKFTL